MKQETIFELQSPYRDTFRIRAYTFGRGEPSVAVVGTMRGDEVQQQYICSQIVAELKKLEQRGDLTQGQSIMVIPSCNPFSLNVGRRFWAMDGTDINRMFPGYDKGETTQRIAAAVFKRIEGYKYGMQLASYYLPGNFVPHVRMLATGYEDMEGARLFGLPFVTTCKPRPFDTTLLNYNWQIWNTRAYSVYGSETDSINPLQARQTVEACLRFMQRVGAVRQYDTLPACDSICFDEGELVNIKAAEAGIFVCLRPAGSHVDAGEELGRIINPYDGEMRERIMAPVRSIVFFVHNRPLTLQGATLFKLFNTAEKKRMGD